ncbi:MAG: heme exporter protein CcmB [Candidatus Marinimicrobia bacterium]|nr:heme exporter protein CcmB [Candidatus Neomarinimicrobiota bacterium]
MASPLSTLIIKELNQELRNKDSILSMAVFGLSIILIFSFAFDMSTPNVNSILPGLIWLTFMFTFIIGLSWNFTREKDGMGISLLLTSPIDRGYIFLSKTVVFTIYLFISQLCLFPLFYLFLGFTAITNWQLWALSLLVNWGMSALGVVISGLGFRSKMGDVLTALLFFPLASPVLISAVKSTSAISRGIKFELYSFWCMLILSFAVGFTVLGMFLFDYIMEE